MRGATRSQFGRRAFAPGWMQRLGLTWLYRMSKEPRRPGPRYIQYNSLFVYYLVRDWLLGPPREGV
ncbi:MAG TPA: WecB/TagA/CpsF family glycosyltransferase [Chthoniobacterales bacterium]|nr:WecB/TagA/CpsF family glycosyltransferase [Chthoniobacterales bacterium]